MRARVLPFDLSVPGSPTVFDPTRSQQLEDTLNAWLEDAGSIRVDSVNVLGELRGMMVVFFTDPSIKSSPKTFCTQCRKNPPANGLKTCEPCQDYQRDYRKKRKEESKARYP